MSDGAVRWQRNAFVGGLVGAVVGPAAYLILLVLGPYVGMAGIPPLLLLNPSIGIVGLMGPLTNAVWWAAVVVANAMAYSVIWVGLRTRGRWQWAVRVAACMLYLGLVALSFNGVSTVSEGP